MTDFIRFAIFATITVYKIATKQNFASQINRLLASATQRRVQILGRNTSLAFLVDATNK